MTEYLLTTLEDEGAHASESPHAMARLIERRAEYTADLLRAGRLRDAGRLRPSKEGKRVRRPAEGSEIKAGPFAEGGKALGGYYWVEAGGIDDAAVLAARCPTLASDEIDVRPLMKGAVPVQKEARPGKIFACAVLGNAATEADWVEVMDQIDAETQDSISRNLVPRGRPSGRSEERAARRDAG